MSKEYYNQDLCDSGGRCKLYNPLLTQGKCKYYNEWCEQQDKIADLEAKLAESEKKLALCEELRDVEETEYSEDISKTNSALFRKCQQTTRLIEENKQLKQQLAEKEKEIEKITKVVAYRDDMDRSTTINGVKFSDEQIITLQNIDYFADKHNQDKISFAVEQLEQLRHDIWTNQADDGYTDMQVDLYDLNDTIDVRIMELKEQGNV